MLQDVGLSVASQTCPSLFAGDLNVSVDCSTALTLASSNGVFPLSPIYEPTTMTKEGAPSKGNAIDLAFGNVKVCDLLLQAQVDRTLLVSDHYLLRIVLRGTPSSFDVVHWPLCA